MISYFVVNVFLENVVLKRQFGKEFKFLYSRLLLEYTGSEYEDKKLSCGPAPDFDKSCWFDHKFKLGLDFPNVPYYKDGEVSLTQTNAILKYIARYDSQTFTYY